MAIMERRKIAALLGLVFLSASLAPFVTAAGLFNCQGPSDCAAMAGLCDMADMTSHDSCCQPALASSDSTLPATTKAIGSAPAAHAGPGYFAVLDTHAGPTRISVQRSAVDWSPPGGPPAAPVLRI
jgi:hypothetical protein